MRYERVPLATDAGLGPRARIGLLVLKTDQTLEHEARHVCARLDGVALYHARLHNDPAITRETLLAMKPRIPEAASLLPVEWRFKSIAYACTSGAMVIGEREVERLVRSVHPDVAVTNPVTASVAALRAIGARRLAVVTPYARSVNDLIVEGLTASGFEIPSFVSFEESDDNVVGRISAEAILRAAEIAVRDVAVDHVFVACTSLRVIEAIERIEHAISKPATSSNHATLWHLLRLAGIDDRMAGLGRLFRIA